MDKIIKCVPNFSEGRNQKIIGRIAEAISNVEGCTLLDVDPGASTNRTVYTFVGDQDTIIEGALAGARLAKELIDMRTHSGEHPRFGALDVCPFIPVKNITMAECVEISKEFAQRASEELGVPFFLYEESSSMPHRKHLSDIRRGEYEALEPRLKDPAWKPDYGPVEFLPTWGATATGARSFLIAYNVNILGTPNQAHRIALDLREAGRGEGEEGELREVKGMGWYVQEYNLAQVTVNLTNFRVTPIHLLFEKVKEKAEERNLAVAGSEIIGLVPLEALLMVSDYYIEKEKLFIYQEEQKIRLAIERLGLNSLSPFEPDKRIIDYVVARPPNEPLANSSLRNFIEELGARTTAPGGGSASAAIAAIGVALGAMVAKLTQGVRKFEASEKKMQKSIPILYELMGSLISMIDKDTLAYNTFMEGLRMPKGTEKERRIRHKKMQEGLMAATNIPLETMRLGDKAWEALLITAKYGNPASKSDIQVGVQALKTGIWGAYQNVLINLVDIEDLEFKKKIESEITVVVKRAEEMCSEVLKILNTR